MARVLSGVQTSELPSADIMNNFSSELFLNFIGPAYEVKDLRSTFIANCVFNNFLYLHYVEHCYSLCYTKDIFVTKDFGNIVEKSRCFRC